MRVSTPLYWAIQKFVPIACVDVLPYRHTAEGTEICMIWRDDGSPGQRGWALVGGHVKRGEELDRAVTRHLVETLGESARWGPVDVAAPLRAVQYFPDGRPGYPRDPRKHAVALTYVVEYLGGVIEERNEAKDFEWFSLAGRPDVGDGAYGHVGVVEELLSAERVPIRARLT